LKIQALGICSGASSIYKFFYIEKYQNLTFWWYFKVPQANCFWADFDNFGQFWANFATLAILSKPKL
jgi:hypothetical protein